MLKKNIDKSVNKKHQLLSLYVNPPALLKKKTRGEKKRKEIILGNKYKRPSFFPRDCVFVKNQVTLHFLCESSNPKYREYPG